MNVTFKTFQVFQPTLTSLRVRVQGLGCRAPDPDRPVVGAGHEHGMEPGVPLHTIDDAGVAREDGKWAL